MARIRSIKPETPQDEKYGAASRDARLLFLQLFTVADDYGRFRANAAVLKGQLYPYDETLPSSEVSQWLDELKTAGMVELYAVDGQKYGSLTNWAKHQRIDNAAKSSLPPPPAEVRGDSPQAAAKVREITQLAAGEDRRGIGEEPAANCGVEARPFTADSGANCVALEVGFAGDRHGKLAVAAQLEAETANAKGMMETIEAMIAKGRAYKLSEESAGKFRKSWQAFYGSGQWRDDPTRWGVPEGSESTRGPTGAEIIAEEERKHEERRKRQIQAAGAK